MGRFALRAIALSALAALPACYAATPAGWFDDHAFYAARQHYRVRYVAGGESRRALAPQGWRLTNYQYDPEGRPTYALLGQEHMTTIEVDQNLDGMPDTWIREPESELHLEHDSDAAAISVRTVPLQGATAQRSLSAIANTIIEALVTHDSSGKWMQSARLSLAARIVEEGPVSFGATPAHGTVLEVHNLDQPEGSPERVVAKVAFVLARPTSTWSASGTRGNPGDFPMIVLFVYAARPDAFDLYRGDFEAMLDRTDFRDTTR